MKLHLHDAGVGIDGADAQTLEKRRALASGGRKGPAPGAAPAAALRLVAAARQHRKGGAPQPHRTFSVGDLHAEDDERAAVAHHPALGTARAARMQGAGHVQDEVAGRHPSGLGPRRRQAPGGDIDGRGENAEAQAAPSIAERLGDLELHRGAVASEIQAQAELAQIVLGRGIRHDGRGAVYSLSLPLGCLAGDLIA